MPKATALYEFLIPVRYNDDTLIPDAVHTVLKGHIIEKSGGVTVLPERTGAWVNDKGILMEDATYALQGILTDAEAVEFANRVMTLCHQEAVLFYVVSREVKLLTPQGIR